MGNDDYARDDTPEAVSVEDYVKALTVDDPETGWRVLEQLAATLVGPRRSETTCGVREHTRTVYAPKAHHLVLDPTLIGDHDTYRVIREHVEFPALDEALDAADHLLSGLGKVLVKGY
jgi:predicted transcriptional regulator